jgi:hypothetical protein
MKYYLLYLLLFFSTSSWCYDVSKNPIFHAIVTLNKKIDKKDALEYSNIIYKYSKNYQIDPFLVVAISRQESYLNLNSVRQVEHSGIYFDKQSNKFIKKIELTDFCMMQINKSNVIAKKLDPDKLLNDPDYCIHEGMKILSYFKKLYGSETFWWTRYNSPTDKHREIYKEYVLSHYNKISHIVSSTKAKGTTNFVALGEHD